MDLNDSAPASDSQGPKATLAAGENANKNAQDHEVNLSVAARDPRDEAIPATPPATVSRPASPYTLNPPIDFDGLSWPSECPML